MSRAFIYGYAYFVLYSFLGWICESTYVSIPRGHFVNRGFFYGPYIPIYGFGALISVYILMPYVSNPIFVFLIGAFLCTILEYFTSWIMELLFHMRWWDYSHKKFNIHGRVCLLNTTLFGIMSVFVVYFVHPITADLFQSIPFLYITNFLSAFTSCFIIDGIMTLISLMHRKHVIEKIHAQMQNLEVEFADHLQESMIGVEDKMEKFDEMRYEYKEHKEQRKQDAQAHRDEVVHWIANRPKMEDRLKKFHKEMEYYHDLTHTHMDRAYSNSDLNKDFAELQKLAEDIHKKVD